MVFALPKSTIAARKHPVRRNVARVLAATARLAPLVLATARAGHAGESDSGPGGDANGRTQNTGRAAGSTIAEHENFTSPQARMAAAPSGVAGIDVSNWQGNINWNAVAADGIEFAYIKATGGTGYTDSKFDANYIERSEEHTSELQSRFDLVCRLLLEKKNIKERKSASNETIQIDTYDST